MSGEGSTILAPEPEDALDEYFPFLGLPKAPEWKPIACKIYKKRKNTGFASIALAPVLFSPKVLLDETMNGLLRRSCEFLPLKMEDAEPILLHPTLFVDCVDLKRSRIEFNSSDHWVFFPDRIICGKVFKDPGLPMVNLIATDSNLPPEEDFYQWYHKKRYTGLRFKPLWQSEP